MTSPLLGPADVRRLADGLDIRPQKSRGQNFLHDPNTIRRIVRTARLEPGETVLEVGPGLGSLTLGLLEAGHPVVAVELDEALAAALPTTVAERAPDAQLTVLVADAARLTALTGLTGPATTGPGAAPSALVANLPYNAAVPILLNLLEVVPGLRGGLVMVQAEAAQRLAARPGSKVYGVPSVKLAWYARAERAGAIPRAVFWPVPNVDSELVRLTRRPAPDAPRRDVFAAVDAAFAQRRKTLRSALASWAGSAAAAETALRAAGIDPGARGETLDLAAFVALAAARTSLAP